VLFSCCFLVSLLVVLLIIFLCCTWKHSDNSNDDVPGLADGQGIAAVSVLLYWTGWNSNVNLSRNSPEDTKVSEGGGKGAPGAREIPLQPVVKTMVRTMVRQAVPLQPTEVDSGAEIHLQPMGDPTLEHGNV